MSDKPDWASEIAKRLTPYMGSPPRTPEELDAFRSRITSHLHKAKAYGARYIAEWLAGCEVCREQDHIPEIRVLADKIEKGLA